MIFSAVFALIVGIGMIGMWSFLLLTKQVPELETEPLRIRFHIAAEFATSIALVTGGIGLLTGQSWSRSIWSPSVCCSTLLSSAPATTPKKASGHSWACSLSFLSWHWHRSSR